MTQSQWAAGELGRWSPHDPYVECPMGSGAGSGQVLGGFADGDREREQAEPWRSSLGSGTAEPQTGPLPVSSIYFLLSEHLSVRHCRH